MKKTKRLLKRIGLGLLIIVVLLLVTTSIVLYSRYGGGTPYTDLSTAPIHAASELEVVLEHNEPLGNIAVSTNAEHPFRVFFTIHPESRPEGTKLYELVDGRPQPYPSTEAQDSLFTTVLGVYIDQQNRLWTIDHGNHGTDEVRLLAFDLRTNRLVHDYTFTSEVAETGSFFNDLSVTPDGRYVFVADVSFWGKHPSLIVYDTQTQQARSLLDGHPSVTNQGYLPVNPTKRMRFVGGLVDLMPGIDGLDVSPDGQYIYYAAMSHEGLYRLPVAAATNFGLSNEEINAAVEKVATKPLSDGIRVDSFHTTYITDVDHAGIMIARADGSIETLIRDEARIRWADGISLGADGYLYFADSAIPDQMLQSKDHMQKAAPYYLYRIRYTPRAYAGLPDVAPADSSASSTE